MAELVDDCPRCGASKITFDLRATNWIEERYNWQQCLEMFCVCRRCHTSTIFVVAQKHYDTTEFIKKNDLTKLSLSMNDLFDVQGFISKKDMAAEPPPEHLPANIEAAFREGATCLAVGCHNAAGTMFRLCMDFATKSVTPTEDVDGLNAKIRRSLGLRLQWLFDTNRLPHELLDLSLCVKDDGNDGAHEGTLQKADAEDLQDFTVALLVRLYTVPARVAAAKARTVARRKQQG